MIWNWSYHNTIVFSWWHTSSAIGLFAACLLVVTISLSHEYIAFFQAQHDREALTHEATYASLAQHGAINYQVPGRLQRSLFYGMRTFFTVFLMLIMMTFNGFLIISIITGAVIGHYLLGRGAAHH
jgi:copper transporter 1